ncbi:hypothetical protein CYMTET_40505 [Cymbomonas tetramitiformis]|uniref:Uncharacterized protein n=1 Tax=Cymbomonas tetramitiformis TaxID=36881 RepID=A0AAE0F2X1_9CHLO|nr:hypothetical protein CYMTET_40505 [Cymbomonas tetramitiformis]
MVTEGQRNVMLSAFLFYGTTRRSTHVAAHPRARWRIHPVGAGLSRHLGGVVLVDRGMEVASLAGGAALRLPVHGAADLGIADSSTVQASMYGPSGFCAGNMCTLNLASLSASDGAGVHVRTLRLLCGATCAPSILLHFLHLTAQESMDGPSGFCAGNMCTSILLHFLHLTVQEFMDGPSGFCAGNMCTLDLASFSASACAAVREAVLGGGMALGEPIPSRPPLVPITLTMTTSTGWKFLRNMCRLLCRLTTPGLVNLVLVSLLYPY